MKEEESDWQRQRSETMATFAVAIVDDVRCAKCGGVILKQVAPLGMLTPGGSPIIGCPKCKTFSYKHDRSEFVKLVVKK